MKLTVRVPARGVNRPRSPDWTGRRLPPAGPLQAVTSSDLACFPPTSYSAWFVKKGIIGSD